MLGLGLSSLVGTAEVPTGGFDGVFGDAGKSDESFESLDVSWANVDFNSAI